MTGRALDTRGRSWFSNVYKCVHGFVGHDAPGVRKKMRAGRVRMSVIPDASSATLVPWVQKNVAAGSHLVTDGSASYNPLTKLGYIHGRLPVLADGLVADGHNGHDDEALRLRAPSRAALLDATDVGFIDLDFAAQGFALGVHEPRPQLVEELEGGLVPRQPELALELHGADTGRVGLAANGPSRTYDAPEPTG